MLVPPERSSAVLVMISSNSVYICNVFMLEQSIVAEIASRIVLPPGE